MINIGKNFIDILHAYELRKKIITYVKNEGSNLNTMTSVFKYIVNVELWALRKPFKGHVLGIFSPKLANMLRLMKNFKGTSYMFL
jgi:hypothetical protein